MKHRGPWTRLTLVLLISLVWNACSNPEGTTEGGERRPVNEDRTPEERTLEWAASGGWKAAQSAIERQLAESKGDPEWTALAVRAEMEQGHFDKAGERLLAALRENPNDPYLRVERGVFEASRHRHSEVVRVLEPVVEAHPEMARAQEFLGRSLEFEAMIQMGSRGIDFDVLGRSIDALEAAVRLGENVPRLETLGGALERAQRLEDALAAHRRVTELAPEHAPSWHAIGRILTELGQLDEAERALRPALRFAEEDAETWFDYGVLLEETGDMEKARMAYGKAVEFDPAFSRAYYRLGLLTSQAGDTAGGEALMAQYERYQEMHDSLQGWRFEARKNGDEPETVFQLGLAHARVLQWDKALPWLKRAVMLNPDDARAHFQLGRLHLNEERMPEALAALDLAVEKRPEHTGAHGLRWQVANQVGRFDKSEKSLEALLGQGPDDVGLWFNLGQVRRQLDLDAEAVNAFGKALELDPVNQLALEMIARVELGLDRKDDARKHANALLALVPDHEVAKALLAELNVSSSEDSTGSDG